MSGQCQSSLSQKKSPYQDLFVLQYKGLKYLKEHKSRKLPNELSSDDDCDTEKVNSNSIVSRMMNRIDRNLKNCIKIQSRVI